MNKHNPTTSAPLWPKDRGHSQWHELQLPICWTPQLVLGLGYGGREEGPPILRAGCELSVSFEVARTPGPWLSDQPSQKIFSVLQSPDPAWRAAKSKIQILSIYYHLGQKWRGDGNGGELKRLIPKAGEVKWQTLPSYQSLVFSIHVINVSCHLMPKATWFGSLVAYRVFLLLLLLLFSPAVNVYLLIIYFKQPSLDLKSPEASIFF